MTSYSVRIIGENQHLGRKETEALLALIGIQDKSVWKGQVVQFEADVNPLQFLLDRAALIREVGVVLFKTDDVVEMTTSMPKESFKTWVLREESFSVRVFSLDRTVDVERKHNLEVDLGRQIQHATGARVSLDKPDIRITVYLGKESALIAKTQPSFLRRQLAEREPGQKQFFHPSMMNSQLARVMCNLAGIMPGNIVLDPFCGGGGILCEISSIGAIGIGVDVNWSLLVGAMTNLVEMKDMDSSIVQGDSRLSPFQTASFDAIVTDPPYGRASSTRGAKAIELTESLIEQVPYLLRRKGRLCICGSSEMNISDIVENHSLRLIGDYRIRVHSGLTRNVVIASI
jgi:tRNA (guanine10-N2)-dimethyltransferase